MSTNRAAGLLLVAATMMPAARTAAQTGAPRLRTLTEQEMVDMMVGSSIQSSRSSNSDAMIARVRAAFAEGKTFTMIAVDDMPADWTVVIPSGIGGGGAWEYVRERAQKQALPTVADPMRLAIDRLALHVGKPFRAVLRSEAAGSTLTAFLMASALGVPVVDGCPVGRAVPEMQQSVPFINGILGAPAALVTRWGDTIVLDKAVDDYRLEDVARALAVASGGSVQMASNAMSTAEVKRGVIRGSISEAIRYGRAVREARGRHQDPVAALIKESSGFELFRGRVTKADSKGERGFTWSDVELKGAGRYEGHTYKVFVKNENIVSWLDGVPDAMAPDLICNLDPRTGDTVFGQGLGAYPTDADVVMIGIPSSALWRNAKGIEVLGPRHFGFDFDYVALETLQQRRVPLSGR
jgi:DUF917 family protein